MAKTHCSKGEEEVKSRLSVKNRETKPIWMKKNTKYEERREYLSWVSIDKPTD